MSASSQVHLFVKKGAHPSSNTDDILEGRMITPGIVQTSTFDSSSADEGDQVLTIRKSHLLDDDDDGILEHLEDMEGGSCSAAHDDLEKRNMPANTGSSSLEAADCSLFASWEDIAKHVYFISTLAVFGTLTRFYMGRFFGLDCLLKEHDMLDERDFLTPASSLLCITSDGKLQRGGALFIDLPANILGSFVMGLISPAGQDSPPFPWLRSDHRLQRHTALHIGLQVGFCGCLTTFSSWNNQMVIMMDGTDTEFGPQVGTAIFGYILGIACAVSSFVFGRYVYGWLNTFHDRQSSPPQQPSLDEAGTFVTGKDSIDRVDSCKTAASSTEDDARLSSCKWSVSSCLTWSMRYWPCLAVVALVAMFVVEDAVAESLMYRELWMSTLLTPCGALLRWRLSELNDHNVGRIRKDWTWFPRGTFAVNVVAALICAFVEAFLSRHVDSTDHDDMSYRWIYPSLRAVAVGFAGSLSTVSTLVREMVSLETPGHASCYCLATIVCSMLFSLLIYSPMIRAE